MKKTCNKKYSEETITIPNFPAAKSLVWLVIISSVASILQLASASHLPSNYPKRRSSGSDFSYKPPAPVQIPIAPSSELELNVEDDEEPSSSLVRNVPVAATSQSTHHLKGRKYSSISAFCDDRQMTIFGEFYEPFKGRMYAYGYPDEGECGVTAANDPSENITFHLPLGQCGVQMTALDDDVENDMRHEVTLYLQYSSFLQQIIDEKVFVSCVEVKPATVDDAAQTLDEEEAMINSRKGRRLGLVKDTAVKPVLPKISSKIGEAWMEILAGKDPTPKSKRSQPIAVGEDVTLVISTKIMRGYDGRIVNCTAHDGSRTGSEGYRAQQILDSAGCSVDKALVPNFRRRRLPIESRNRLITLHFATFPAFKFPERDHLHIKCAVAYCQGPCPQEPCDTGINHFGTWKEKYGRIADVLVDNSEIVNSVEVSAPELEDIGGHHYERHQSSSGGAAGGFYSSGAAESSSRQFSDTGSFPTNNNAGNGQSLFGNNQVPLLQANPNNGNGNVNNVCVSPGTVILALVILGVVLVISATATLWFALKRSEAKKYHQAKHAPFQPGPQPYYRFSHW